RAAQARSRQGAGLDEEGRAAVRPRDALPRCRRHHEAGKAQQSGKGGPAQGTQGQGRGSHQGQGSQRRGGQDGGDRQGRYRQGRGRQGQGGKAGRSTGGELNFYTPSPRGRGGGGGGKFSGGAGGGGSPPPPPRRDRGLGTLSPTGRGKRKSASLASV